MRLNNFEIEFITEDFSGFARQGKKRVYTNAEIRSENNRHRFGCFFNVAPLLGRVSSRADNKWTSTWQCSATNFFDRAGLTKINCDIAVLHGRCDVITKITLGGDL